MTYPEHHAHTTQLGTNPAAANSCLHNALLTATTVHALGCWRAYLIPSPAQRLWLTLSQSGEPWSPTADTVSLHLQTTAQPQPTAGTHRCGPACRQRIKQLEPTRTTQTIPQRAHKAATTQGITVYTHGLYVCSGTHPPPVSCCKPHQQLLAWGILHAVSLACYSTCNNTQPRCSTPSMSYPCTHPIGRSLQLSWLLLTPAPQLLPSWALQ